MTAANTLPIIIGDGVIPEAEAVRDVQLALAGHPEVVLLAHVAAALGQPIPPGATIYNLEPLYDGCRSLPLGYLDVLRSAGKVWDYQARNVEFLRAHGITATHVPYRYTPALERAPERAKDIDVLFVGSMSPRRRKLLDEIATRCNLVSAQGVYGLELDQLIARARVVVNLHFTDHPHPLEVVRLNYLMANGCAVASERGWDEAENAAYAPGLWFDTDIAAACWLLLDDEWQELGRLARAHVRTMPMKVPA